jgi:NitT/TauT family transport system permease protein
MSDERPGGAVASQTMAFEQPARAGSTPATPTPQPELRKPRAKRQTRARAARVLLTQLVLVGGLLGAWEYGVRTGVVNAFLFGSPSGIWTFLVKGITDGSIFHDMLVTSEETLLGFVLGNALGATIGLALWYSPFLERVFSPFILALGSIPIIALAPLVIVWAGTDLTSKVLMSTLSVVVVALLAAFDGARNTDPLEINLLYSMGATKRQVFRMIVVPSSLTYIFSGLKLTVGFALIGAIIGEFVSSSEGLGHAIFIAGNLYNIPKVFASLLATIAIALVFVTVVGKIELFLLPWRKLST